MNIDLRLVQAVDRGLLEESAALLETGANANATDSNGCPALFWAVDNQDVAHVKLLLDHGADVHTPYEDADDRSLVRLASWYNNDEIMRLLVDHGVLPLDSDGIPALPRDIVNQDYECFLRVRGQMIEEMENRPGRRTKSATKTK